MKQKIQEAYNVHFGRFMYVFLAFCTLSVNGQESEGPLDDFGKKLIEGLKNGDVSH